MRVGVGRLRRASKLVHVEAGVGGASGSSRGSSCSSCTCCVVCLHFSVSDFCTWVIKTWVISMFCFEGRNFLMTCKYDDLPELSHLELINQINLRIYIKRARL